MLKRRLFLIIFFITAVLLINAVVLIEASYQHNELSVDAANQIIFAANSGNEASSNTVAYHKCTYQTIKSHCNTYQWNANCVWVNETRCRTEFVR